MFLITRLLNVLSEIVTEAELMRDAFRAANGQIKSRAVPALAGPDEDDEEDEDDHTTATNGRKPAKARK